MTALWAVTRIQVDQDDTLLAFLVRELEDVKRNTIKTRLKHGAIYVNGTAVTQATSRLVRGDVVEWRREGGGAVSGGGLPVLLMDKDLIVVDKPSGLLTLPSHRPVENERNAIELAAAPLLTNRSLFACHRLDRESSGALLIARSEEIKSYFFSHWVEVEKRYIVVVEGQVPQDEGTIDAPLFENLESKAVHVSDRHGCKDAITHFRVRARGPDRTLLEIILETGRRHQIRAHFAHGGHPVVGDPRYGNGKRGAPRMCLHSYRLTFKHPVTSVNTVVECPPPKTFSRLCHAVR
ncbi:MAG: 23S rRNA pseudouridine1911/1915/1917 synthase [Hyphomicrobiaceae bacterium]|jgi:23S rRNA pseudouridine1911/1915/1917 synthase